MRWAAEPGSECRSEPGDVQGWKNFYDEDTPTLSPEQTMSQVVPTPDLVTYE